MSKELCLFIHYDQTNTYSEDDIKYISNLCNIFEKVTLLTGNTDKIKDFKYQEQIEYVLNIPNLGYDFGKIQHYLSSVDINDFSSCYVFNNSCILVRDLRPSLEHMKNKNLDFWGYTTSKARALHIQSYFLYFNASCLKQFKTFLFEKDPIGKNMNFEDIVNNIEIQLLKHFSSKGFKCGSFLHTHKIFGEQDPVVFHADKLLILNHMFPFIKKKVFTHFKTFDRSYLTGLI